MTEITGNAALDALWRLLGQASAHRDAAVDALVALSQRRVWVFKEGLESERLRTLLKDEARFILPLFTHRDLLVDASATLLGVTPEEIEQLAIEIETKDALQVAEKMNCNGIVIDLGTGHALEVDRDEYKPLVQVSARRTTKNTGPYELVGKVSYSLLQAVKAKHPQGEALLSGYLESMQPPEARSTRKPTLQGLAMPATAHVHNPSQPTLVVSEAALNELRASSPASAPISTRPSRPADAPASLLERIQRASNPAPSPMHATRIGQPTQGRISSAPPAPAGTWSSSPPVSAPKVPWLSGLETWRFSVLEPPPAPEVLARVGKELEVFAEVEWASMVSGENASHPEPAALLVLKLQALLPERIDELAQRVIVLLPGVNWQVAVVQSPEQIARLRPFALVFYP